MSRIAGRITVVAALLASAMIAGCASAPKTTSERSQLERDAHRAREAMLVKDPGIRPLLERSAGYIIFPEVKEGGFVVGGAGGQGVVYEHGRVNAFATVSQGSVGAVLGGQKFAELIIVRDKFTLDKIKAGTFDVGAQASAVILKAGAGGATRFSDNGVAVVLDPLSGAMVNAAITGQQIKVTM
jgi:lipid-binding SYLF domain-containing protein